MADRNPGSQDSGILFLAFVLVSGGTLGKTLIRTESILATDLGCLDCRDFQRHSAHTASFSLIHHSRFNGSVDPRDSRLSLQLCETREEVHRSQQHLKVSSDSDPPTP